MKIEPRKQTPYIFYGQTTSLCEECLGLVPAKILIENGEVFYQKRCKDHGVQKTKIASDAEYFKWCKDYLKPGDRPHTYQTKTDYGCPLDCGLCPDHEQHSCLALIEINEECNLACPVCFADSSPARKTNRSLREIEAMLEFWLPVKVSRTYCRSVEGSRLYTRRSWKSCYLPKPSRYVI